MTSSSKPLIHVSELGHYPNAVIIDARGGPDARDRYNKGHAPGALFADLETQLSEKSADAKNGGRHPLPKIETFTKLLSKLGISNDTQVIVYDDKQGANAAARFWWMMKAAGHQHTKVIDGGLQAIAKHGIPLSSNAEQTPQQAHYLAEAWTSPVATLSEVAAASKNDNLVIDVREAYRYDGESEPIDKIAGHIPDAVNIPYISSLNEFGEFLSEEQLYSKFTSVIKNTNPQEVIVHCGSGVTACHTLLAMEQAGIEGARLYVGSWSEWSRNNMPMVTK